MSLTTEALQIFGLSLEPCALCRSASVSTEWNGVIYKLWQQPLYDTLDHRLAIAKIYTQLANERLNRYWKLQIKHTITELKGRLLFPVGVFSTQELIQQASSQLPQFVSKLDNAFLKDVFAEENTFLELKILVQCNPTLEKINDFILNRFDHIFDTIAIYAKETTNQEESIPDNQQEIDLTQIESEHEQTACRFLHSFLASDFWADLLVHTKLETSSGKSLTKTVWLREIRRILPIFLRKSGPSHLIEQFTITELENLTQFYRSPLARSILRKIPLSRIFENIKQFCIRDQEIEQNLIEILQNAVSLKMFIGQEDMHEIIPGLFLGNRNAAGIDHRFNKTSQEVIRQFLQLHHITHIICLSNHQEPIYPKDFTYKLIPIEDYSCIDISAYFDTTFELIEHVLTSGKGILVHCDAGVSRSASIVIAYLMRKNRCDYLSAFNQIRDKRSFIDPNPGFVQQLCNYQEKIKNL